MPAQNQFSGTGIVDGQIVEAPHVSQSVDAFTALKDYDIIISGSLELTGSVNISGSLISEYIGQFTTLGIGTVAPTAPTMLHIKSNAAGGFDPVVLIEGETGNDSAALRLKSPGVDYDLGIEGASDDFKIIQDATNVARKDPFTIDQGTEDYTFYMSGDSVGIGMGASTPSLISALDPGSLQALNLISASSLRGQIISASGAGVGTDANIHGTASYAEYVETAQTASYVKSTNIDFYYSISQQVNSLGTIVAATGSFNHLKLNDDSGAALKNVSDANYTRFISGSTETGQGILWVGNMEPNGTMIEINNVTDYIKLHTDKTYITGDAVIGDDLFISGSVTPSLRVGPNNAPGTINAASASLFANNLNFNNNDTAYIGNYNSSTNSKLQISAGGGGNDASMAVELSASKDVKLSGSLAFTKPPPTQHYILSSFWDLGETSERLDASGRSAYYRAKPIASTSSGTQIIMTFGKFVSQTSENWKLDVSNSPAGQNKFTTHFKICVVGTPSNADGVYMEKEYLTSWNGTTWTVLDSSTLIRKNSNTTYNTTTITHAITSDSTSDCISFRISVGTNTDTSWAAWVETKRVGEFGAY